MATFVLVHGSRHGGWCWQRVARLLRRAGHEVYCPTLSGNGDRSHLRRLGPIRLDDHIADVASLLYFEDVSHVILVGHSYAGVVITGVAQAAAQRIARLVYLDAVVPRSRESHLDLAGTRCRRVLERQIAEQGNGLVLPASGNDPAHYGVHDPDDAAWVAARLTDQPADTYRQPLGLADAARTLPRTYVRCLRSTMVQTGLQERVVDDPGFDVVDIDAGHDAMISDPEPLALLLLQLVPDH